MSSVPSGSAHCSRACRRSATHTPPVWMPTMAVAGVSVGAMASASRAIRESTSGNEACIEKSLQYQLGGHGVRHLWAIVAGVIWEAIHRLRTPEHVDGATMAIIA